MSAFNEHNLLSEEKDLNVHLTETLQAKGKDNLETALKGHSYQIHKRCYDRYNASKLERAKQSAAKKAKKDHPMSRATTRSQQEPLEKFAHLCLYCRKPGFDDPKHPSNSNPLHAAGSRKPDGSYVSEFTKRIKGMASALGDTKVLSACENGNDS